MAQPHGKRIKGDTALRATALDARTLSADISADVRRASFTAVHGSGMLAGVPEPLRVEMAHVAGSAASADEALAPVIALLVSDAAAQKAIVAAYRSQPNLREQWERAYDQLRAETT